ncbi:MAG: FtsX-like permease family protein [Candidatus Nanopelagicales bacterium]|nr:ABC transporter permease [Candidatus Nanopelagicales bacterium]MDZ4249329.1 FtsX-like permease family protein [Candidatus Nanopelagicales bacterium]
MFRATWRTALAHKGRLLLSALAIVLGVAFVTGTLMLTSALDRTFVEMVEGSAQDVQVTRSPAVSQDVLTHVGDSAPLLIPDESVVRVRQVEGVEAAAGTVSRFGVYLIDRDRKVVGAMGPPALGVSWEDDSQLSLVRIVDGRAPAADNEIVVDETTFPKLGVKLGDRVPVVTPAGRVNATLVGSFKFGESGGLAGATLTAFTPEQAQKLLAEPGKWTAIDVAVADGYSDDEVAEAIGGTLGGDVVVKSRAQQVDEQSSALREGLAFFSYFMIGFAAVSLLVAAFLIHNTFSMLVAQRERELALLRSIGMTRRQVLASVLIEALFVAVWSVLIGIGVGYLLALGLTGLFASMGLSLTSGVAITGQAVWWATVVGVLVTVSAALLPAIRAARVPPVAALREAAGARDRVGGGRIAAGAFALAAAVALVVVGLRSDDPGSRALAASLGACALLIAAVLMSPWIGVMLIRALMPVMDAFGRVTGRLAGRNAARSPRRLAATVSALTIGLALVVCVTIVTASAKASISKLVDESFSGDLMIGTQTMQPFDLSIAERARDVPGVKYVMSESTGPALADGSELTVTAVGGGPLEAAHAVSGVEGKFELSPGVAVVSKDLAGEMGWSLNQTVEVTLPSGGKRQFLLGGVYEPSALLTGLVIPMDEYRAGGGAAQDRTLLVTIQPGANLADVTAGLESVAESNPLVQVLDQTAIKEQNSAALDQLLLLVYAMLALSVIIAALGVVNTLALSVLERTAEIGLLRAVGSTRRQVRRMIRWEAILVAVTGGILGIAVGVGTGVILQRALAESGISVLDAPVSVLVVILVLTVLIGVAAAALPARRAALLPMLESISAE